MLCFLLMVIVLAMNVLIYEMAPQYGKFGSQQYIVSSSMLAIASINLIPLDFHLIHFIHCKNLYSTPSRVGCSEALPTPGQGIF